jgi:hypothetical protein
LFLDLFAERMPLLRGDQLIELEDKLKQWAGQGEGEDMEWHFVFEMNSTASSDSERASAGSGRSSAGPARPGAGWGRSGACSEWSRRQVSAEANDHLRRLVHGLW